MCWHAEGSRAARLAVDHAAALQVTLLREHCQGPNAMLYTLPTGGFDPRKSTSFLAAAQAELSEEVGKAPVLPALQCGQGMSPSTACPGGRA